VSKEAVVCVPSAHLGPLPRTLVGSQQSQRLPHLCCSAPRSHLR
jgi:hypothetical protein